ncbi:MAG: type II secretion system F family protein [Thermodesulfobacteriota bacterium]|nr:type II secretion system F family protein [Thermodesulfobacteriota bacterium]
MEILIALAFVVSLFFLLMGLRALILSLGKSGQARVRQRLKSMDRKSKPSGVDIERRRSFSDLPWFQRGLRSLSWAKILDTVLVQAQVKANVGVFVLGATFAGLAGFVAAFAATRGYVFPVTVGLCLGALPFMWLRRRWKKRMLKFQRGLPDALDLIARALQAGHAFSQGMRMVADEFGDPIGPEFEKTLDEINFGVAAGQALRNLTERVSCPDLKFFVVSVNIQRETGGNLAEIVTNIARLVRERFKLQGRVRVLSAEGKLSAYVLLALPFVIAFVIKLINPEYMGLLFETEQGKALAVGALGMMCMGAVVICKMVKIKV